MDRLTADQLASEAGVEDIDVVRLCERGVLASSDGDFTWADIYRVRTMLALEEAGVPLERLAPEVGSGRLSLGFLEVLMPRPSPATGRTFAQFAESLGQQGPLAGQVYEMLGLALPPANMPMREDEERMVGEMIALWAEDPQIMKRAARVVGRAVRLLVEGWTSLHYELYRGLGGGGRDRWPPELRDHEPRMAGRAMRLAQQIPAWLILRHYEQVLYSDILESVEMRIDPFGDRDPTRPVARQPAVVFIDLSGFTEMTEALGDDVAASTTEQFEEQVSLAALRHGGRVVKLLGDGALLHFPDAISAIMATRRVCADLHESALEPHVGIDCGPVAERDGDVFGRTVNMAARLATAAGSGQILVSETVAEVARLGSLEAHSLGPRRLKGLERPVPVFLLEVPPT